MAAVVGESGAQPPPVTSAAIEEVRTTAKTTAPSRIGATGQGWLERRGRGDGALG
jgi:hypothetical protein